MIARRNPPWSSMPHARPPWIAKTTQMQRLGLIAEINNLLVSQLNVNRLEITLTVARKKLLKRPKLNARKRLALMKRQRHLLTAWPIKHMSLLARSHLHARPQPLYQRLKISNKKTMPFQRPRSLEYSLLQYTQSLFDLRQPSYHVSKWCCLSTELILLWICF